MKRGFGYSIDYDAEIAEDERQIRALSHPFMRAVSAEVERLIVSGAVDPSLVNNITIGFLLTAEPALVDASGLTVEEAAIYSLEDGDVGFWQTFRRRLLIGRQLCPDGVTKWDDFAALRESGKQGRFERLRHARADLSRHSRNKEKNAA